MKTALITGASSGMGKEFAYQLAQKGYNIAVTARRIDRLEALAKDLSSKYKIKTWVFKADLSKEVDNLIAQIEENNIEIDFLVNNAGFGQRGAFEDFEWDLWQDMIQLNITALTKLTYHFYKKMINKKSGIILNVSSVAAYQAVPWFSVYAATKSYVLNFSEALAEEAERHNITVSCLCPGPVKTEFVEVSQMAESTDIPFVWAEAEEVVSKALEAAFKGERVCIPQFLFEVQTTIGKLLPREITTKLAGLFYKT